VTQLDDSFRAQRAQLRDQVVAQAAAIWQAQHTDRNRYLAQVLTAVEAGQRATATLTSAYLTAKAREVGHARFKSLSLADYTVEKLRGTPAVEVYARPYGALYGQLNQGTDETAAQASALDAVSKLAATDVHMAYTSSARDWMAGDKSISAFKRVPSGTCDYCEEAAQGLYQPTVQMPIHENCQCDLEPVFGPAAVAATGLGFHAGDSGAVSDNQAGDLESRLDTTGDVPAPPKRRHK
jgi:hypothetical protein